MALPTLNGATHTQWCYPHPIALPTLNSEAVQYCTPGGVIIAPQDTVRDLGVYISEDRRWSTQIDKTVQGGRKMAAWVLSAFQDRSASVMLTLYKSIVRSKLEYCSPVWNPTNIGETEKLVIHQ